jgi:hypothetical protein
MVSEAETELADVAVIVAVVVEETGDVVTGNDALVWPCGTFTEGGTPAVGLLLARLTETPPAGAGALMVTVPVAPWPPVTAGGEMVRPVMVPELPGLMVNPADTVLADIAVMVATVVLVTGVVVTGNDALI